MPSVLIRNTDTGYAVGSTQTVSDATALAWVAKGWAALSDTVSPVVAAAQVAKAIQDAGGGSGGSGTLGPVADLATLNSTYPAASNALKSAYVTGVGFFDSDGSTWVARNSGGGSGSATYSNIATLNVTTSATPGDASFAALPSAACTEVVFENNTGVTLEFLRSGQSVNVPVTPGSRRRIPGLSNASALSWRRVDYATIGYNTGRTVDVTVVARTSTDTATHVATLALTITNGGAFTSLPSQACDSIDVINTLGKDLIWRRNGVGSGIRVRPGDSFHVSGLANANEIAVQPIDAVAVGALLAPLVIECYNGLKSGLNRDSAPGLLNPASRIPLGESAFPAKMPLGTNFATLGSLRQRSHLKQPGKVNLARFRTVATTICTRPGDIADVTTGEMLFGTSAVEYTQSAISACRFASDTALATGIDVSNGWINLTAGWPNTTPILTSGGTTVEVRLYSAGTPSSPPTYYYSFVLSAGDSFTRLAQWRNLSDNATPFSWSIPVGAFSAVTTGGTPSLSGILFADIRVSSNTTANNGAKFRPMSIDFIPNAMSKGAVIFHFDDLYRGPYDNLLPMLSRYNYPAVLGVDTTAKMGQTGALTPSEVFSLVHNHGWQAGFQIYRSEASRDESAEEFSENVSKHLLTMSALGIGDTEDASYGTAGSITNIDNNDRGRVARGYFRSIARFYNGVAAGYPPFPESVPFACPHNVRRYNMNTSTAGTELATWTAFKDTAKTHKGVAIFGAHADFETAGSAYCNAFQSLIDSIRADELAGLIEVHTYASLIKKYGLA